MILQKMQAAIIGDGRSNEIKNSNGDQREMALLLFVGFLAVGMEERGKVSEAPPSTSHNQGPISKLVIVVEITSELSSRTSFGLCEGTLKEDG